MGDFTFGGGERRPVGEWAAALTLDGVTDLSREMAVCTRLVGDMPRLFWLPAVLMLLVGDIERP